MLLLKPNQYTKVLFGFGYLELMIKELYLNHEDSLPEKPHL